MKRTMTILALAAAVTCSGCGATGQCVAEAFMECFVEAVCYAAADGIEEAAERRAAARRAEEQARVEASGWPLAS